MRRGAIVCGILAVFVGSLILTTMAEARAGGGGFSGGRGSRSYSAPRSPSTPASPGVPASPTSPQRNLSQPGPQRPGGLFGGWGGMIGGFLLGGLLGSLLFGGLGHGGGVGLLDIALIAGLGYLVFTFLRRREPAPALAGASAGGERWSPTATAAAEPSRPAGRLDDDLEQGVAAVRMMDPAFDPGRFTVVARDLFVRVQAAWSARDLAPVRAELTEEMVRALEPDLARLATLRRVNRIEKLGVDAVEATEAWQEYGRDFVTVQIRANALDYTVDETTGAVVEGSSTVPTTFEEYWTFTRPVGPNTWRLSAIQQPSA
jgi:predicted lipid-binding transport protein (Tim44 family)